jgi:hypothetical protein
MSLATYRPRTVAEIVDATFGFYRANLATLVTVAVVVLGPIAILKGVAPAAWGRILDVAGNLLVPVAEGAITLVVAAAVERSERLDVGAALRGLSDRVGSLIAVQIASGLMMLIGLILLVVPGVIAIIWTAVAIPVVIVEQVGYSRAIDRSRALVRHRWMPVLGTLLLAWGLAFVIMIGGGAVGGLLGLNDRVADLVFDLLFAAVIPIPAIALTLLYFDLRVRAEGADLEALASELHAVAPVV